MPECSDGRRSIIGGNLILFSGQRMKLLCRDTSQLIGLVLAFGALTLVPARAQERVVTFLSDVHVQPNGDLLVEERITVFAEGKSIRRGIWRGLPMVSTRTEGTPVVASYEILSVMRNGATEQWITEPNPNVVRLRIGRLDQLITTGEHLYQIRYRTTRHIRFFGDYDELLWNVTGTGWTFAIEQAEARITLPVQVAFKQASFYTGPEGARGKDAMVAEQRLGHILVRTTKSLPVANGLVVTTSWQKGIVNASAAVAAPTISGLDFLVDWPKLRGQAVRLVGGQIAAATTDYALLSVPGGNVTLKPPWTDREDLRYLFQHCTSLVTGNQCVMDVTGVVDEGTSPQLNHVKFHVKR
jgi:hypothetical protein